MPPVAHPQKKPSGGRQHPDNKKPATAAQRKRAQRDRARQWNGANISDVPTTSLIEELAREVSKGSPTMVEIISAELLRRTREKREANYAAFLSQNPDSDKNA